MHWKAAAETHFKAQSQHSPAPRQLWKYSVGTTNETGRIRAGYI